ncbi:hypothetical protein D9M69_643220 [compost metagenome]
MLIWHKELWLIDHGACLYFHHSWNNWENSAKTPFALIKDHVLLPKASNLEEVDKEFRLLLTEEKIRSIVGLIPEEWLQWEGSDETPDQIRNIYSSFLITRLANSEIFIKAAQDARQILI